MEFRKLGRTGLDVSVIGLGTEYLSKHRRTAVETVREAIECGVNYIDLVFSFPEYLDNLGTALQGQRERILLAGHLGSTVKDGQYHKSRSLKTCEMFFLDVLSKLKIDYVDILMLHNCDRQKDYDTIMKPGGVFDLARRFRQEGKTRFIGFSGHTATTAQQAVESGEIDVLMFPINMTANAVPGKKDLLKTCASHNVGLVAMKPFAGGKLLSKDRTVRVARYQRGGEMLKLKKLTPITPVHCLAYVLAQVGVSTTIPGCVDQKHLAAALAYLKATEEEKDFSAIVADFQQHAKGECVYCNHCLPCPSGIDIGQTIRVLEIAQQALTIDVQTAYNALPANASECVECGACEQRCPFEVNVISKMQQAKALFENIAEEESLNLP